MGRCKPILAGLLVVFVYSAAHLANADDLPTADEEIAAGHRKETDVTEALRDAADVSGTGVHEFRKDAEKFTFQAEVNRLMEIIVSSLYSNKDIFLRELISNTADALDKIRLLSLTDKSQMDTNDKLEVRVALDHEHNVLKIRDTGIGMTRQELIDNLGTIAKSGTSAFLETLQKGGDVNLIGQFGVGFYSVFLVADYVEVISKHNSDRQWHWESKADGSFAISEDNSEPLGRGTLIKVHLKEETQEYANEDKLKELIGKFSEFINFPIYLRSSRQIEVAAEKEGGDSGEDIEDEDDPEEQPKMEKKTVWEWGQLNDNKPLWLRNPSEVTEFEYNKFYKSLAKAWYSLQTPRLPDLEVVKGQKRVQTKTDPLAVVHFKGEGDIEFRSILFIPRDAPSGLVNDYYNPKTGLDLYVRRVFITNELDELVPRYLSFLKGIVDSDTLPLSVSREVLQEHTSLKVIKKKIVRKTLDVLKQLAETETELTESGELGPEDIGDYTTFWRAYSKVMKLGLIEDSANRQRLARLLRFHTSKSFDDLVSLEEYIERMQPTQKKIYFFIGDHSGQGSFEEMAESPYLEKLLARDYEVIFFNEAVDEYLMQHLTEFEDVQFQSAVKEKLTLGQNDDVEKQKEKAAREEFKPLTKWWKELIAPLEVSMVKTSRRLAKTPAIVVVGDHAWSANMERVMKAQAISERTGQARAHKMDKTLEINPRHPIIQELRKKFEADPEAEETKEMASIIYGSALLESGYDLPSPKEYNKKIYRLLARSIQSAADFTKGAEFEAEDDDVIAEGSSGEKEEGGDDASEPAPADDKEEL